MRRILIAAAIAAFVLAVAPFAAFAFDESQSQLGGYVAGAAGWAYSFQPVIPSLLPTGDAPFETTFSLSNASVKSGGNAFARGAIVWPGSAAANLGPLLGTGVNQPFVGGLFPPWPAAAEASAKDGEVVKSAGPAISMRAFGSDSRAEGDVRTPDVNFPGFLKIDSVSSNSVAEVTDIDVTSSCTVHLEGVSLFDGAITFKSIYSRSLTRSTGATSTVEGALQIVGLKVTGIEAELTGDGIRAKGLPDQASPLPGATAPFPGVNPDDSLNQALKNLGATIQLTKPIEHHKDGTADRLATGVLISVNNPAFAGSHLDITLASTGSAALATVPLDLSSVSGTELVAGGTDLSGASSTPSLGATPSSDFGSSSLGGLALGPAAGVSGAATAGGNGTDVSTALAGYHFKGVPWRLILVLLVVSVFVARWLRRFLQTRLLS